MMSLNLKRWTFFLSTGFLSTGFLSTGFLSTGALVITGLTGGLALAQTKSSNPLSRAERAAILDAVRVRSVRDLGAPVEFVVKELNQNGSIAFIELHPQRPGGRQIDLARTHVGRNGAAAEMDGVHTEAFLFKRNGRWQVEFYSIGSTDLWYANPELCPRYRPVIPRSVVAAVCGRP